MLLCVQLSCSPTELSSAVLVGECWPIHSVSLTLRIGDQCVELRHHTTHFQYALRAALQPQPDAYTPLTFQLPFCNKLCTLKIRLFVLFFMSYHETIDLPLVNSLISSEWKLYYIVFPNVISQGSMQNTMTYNYWNYSSYFIQWFCYINGNVFLFNCYKIYILRLISFLHNRDPLSSYVESLRGQYIVHCCSASTCITAQNNYQIILP